MIRNIVHQHPLSLCENNGQLLCRGCGESLFGNYCCCFSCGFCQNICSACDKTISAEDSFYICELCRPQSPIFHQSCVDLPAEIQIITYRPHCLLHFEKESSGSGSDTLYCDFCKQRHRGFKFCCELCEFQIGVGCASKLIKYHQGHEHVEHFSHHHPLTLLKPEDFIECKMCFKRINDGPSYGCAPCEFYIHNSCRELPQKIRHPFHPRHSVKLKIDETFPRRCAACCFEIQGLRYHCEDPWCISFDLHPECTSLKPNIKYKGHPQPLILVENLSYKSNCESCGSDIQGVRFMRCVECDLDFHVHCDPKPLPSTVLEYTDDCKSLEGQERIEHFSHEHTLIISEVADFNCKLCYKNIDGPCYGCAAGCEFYIHNSCGTLPKEIRHSFHPRHSLKLMLRELPGDWCRACYLNVHGFRYRCDKCHVNLHPGCIYTKANIVYEGHDEHLLFLVENMSNLGLECGACGLRTEGPFFMRCAECQLNFHVQCGPHPLPQTVMVNQHEHRLTLRTETLAEDNFDQPHCTVCNGERNQEHPSYYCTDCDYYAHVRCAITEVQVDKTKRMRHFSHRHLLLLLENERNSDDVICRACEEKIKASPTFWCHQCKYYLHKSCAELPRANQHPFHRHPLILLNNPLGTHHQCNACGKHFKGFRYCCEDCKFNLDLDCSLLIPSIKLESSSVHHHTLTLFRQLYGSLDCHGCNLIPPNRNTSLDLGALYVRCVKCNFNRHLLCCPLPKTIQRDDIHHHRVTLKDNFDDIFDDFEDDEYCCDVCETRRQAGECVYHCKECNFVVDLDCVSCEVMQFLEGKRKDVDTRIISRAIPRKRKGLSLKDMVGSLTEEDKKCFTVLKQKLMEGSPMDTLDELKATNQLVYDKIEEWLKDVDDELLQMRITEEVERIMEVDDDEDELVKVGAYKISRTHAQVLNNLLDKYGDFGVSCPLTQNLKTMFLRSLCSVLQEMSNTKLMEIRDSTVIWWWFLLKIFERAGFTVDFALDHIKSTAAIALFLQYNKRVIQDNPFYELHKGIRKYSEEMDELKAKTDKLKKQIQDTLSTYGSEQLKSETKRINQALGFQWKKAAIGLFEGHQIL